MPQKGNPWQNFWSLINHYGRYIPDYACKWGQRAGKRLWRERIKELKNGSEEEQELFIFNHRKTKIETLQNLQKQWDTQISSTNLLKVKNPGCRTIRSSPLLFHAQSVGSARRAATDRTIWRRSASSQMSALTLQLFCEPTSSLHI